MSMNRENVFGPFGPEPNESQPASEQRQEGINDAVAEAMKPENSGADQRQHLTGLEREGDDA
jgi:hypothetical protein